MVVPLTESRPSSWARDLHSVQPSFVLLQKSSINPLVERLAWKIHARLALLTSRCTSWGSPSNYTPRKSLPQCLWICVILPHKAPNCLQLFQFSPGAALVTSVSTCRIPGYQDNAVQS